MCLALLTPMLWLGLGVSPPELTQAEDQLSHLKYAAARATLNKARGTKALDRASLLRILELQGVVAAQLRQSAAAEAAFRELLVLEPTSRFGEGWPAAAVAAFRAAGDWVTAHGSLQARPSVVQSGGKLSALRVEVLQNPLARAKQVRFHLMGSTPLVEQRPLEAGHMVLPSACAEVTWWAEVLDANDSQLFLLGSEARPLVHAADAPTPPLITAPPAVAAQPERERPPAATVVHSSTSAARTTSYFLFGGAALAAGLGVTFGVLSADAFGKVTRAAAADPITSLTEVQASTFNRQGALDATVANTLFISAGVLGVTSVVLWVVGAPVTVAAGPGGVQVSGRFP